MGLTSQFYLLNTFYVSMIGLFIIILVHLGLYDSCSYITLDLHIYFIV